MKLKNKVYSQQKNFTVDFTVVDLGVEITV